MPTSWATAPASALLADGNFAEIGTLLDAVYRTTKIPSRLEMAAIHKGLKESAAAAHLLEGLLALLATPNAQTFARLADAVAALPAHSKGPHVQTWPTVTILPFLADPTRFIVSKPEIGKQVAGRLGKDLVYSSAVKWDTYNKVLDMSRTRAREAGAAGRHRLHRRPVVHLGHAQADVARASAPHHASAPSSRASNARAPRRRSPLPPTPSRGRLAPALPSCSGNPINLSVQAHWHGTRRWVSFRRSACSPP